TVYAGLLVAGVAKSTDGGGHWTAVNSGLANLFVETLVAHPSTPGTVYVGTNGPGGGLSRTTNGGASWTLMNNGLADNEVFAIAIDPTAPNTLYAGTSVGVFRSR